jgi:PPOX class probable F420-dependent enzyme
MSIATEKYVSITTFRKNGTPVPSPVWIAPLNDGMCGFTTDLSSGKVKRLRNDPKVTLRPCDMRGRVAEGAPEIAATAAVVVGAASDPVRAAIVAKYGLLARAMLLGSSISEQIAKLRKKPVEDRCAIVITPAPGA